MRPKDSHVILGCSPVFVMIGAAVILPTALVFAQPTAFWIPTTNPNGGAVHALVYQEDGNYLFATTSDSAVLRSSDGGATWISCNNGLDRPRWAHCFCFTFNGRLLLGKSWGIYRSSTNGNSWTPMAIDSNIDIYTLERTERSGTFFAGTNGNGLYRSSDDGYTWTHIQNGLTTPVVNSLTSIASADDTNEIVLAGGDINTGLFRSTDAGMNWSHATGSMAYRSVFGLATSPPSAGPVVVYAALWDTGGVFRSLDSGKTWQSTSRENMTDTHAGSVIVANDGTVFVGTYGGVFRSTDRGDHWTDVSDGLTDIHTSCFAFDFFGYLLVGTDGGYVYHSRDIVNTPDAAEGPPRALPVKFSLEQNYPNPFNPTTNFQFSIANLQLTVLQVYDVLGREVVTLVSEVKQPGSYTVRWDASNNSSGVYYYRLQAGTATQTKKMILIR
jgi:photosystem II stability/assembly factor-like uncharacterized protein